VLAPLAKKKPFDRGARFWMRQVYHARAIAMTELARHADAAASWQRALDFDDGLYPHLTRMLRDIAAARAGGTVPPMPALRSNLAAALAEAKAYEGLAIAFGSEFYALAGLHALAVQATAGDERLPLAVREKRCAECAAHAVALLRRAREDGYFRVSGRRDGMRSDPVFATLRGREDFEDLLE
jgi:hypothetical protein